MTEVALPSSAGGRDRPLRESELEFLEVVTTDPGLGICSIFGAD